MKFYLYKKPKPENTLYDIAMFTKAYVGQNTIPYALKPDVMNQNCVCLHRLL